MQTIYFDIETGALPEDELAALVPPFDPGEVKTGNLRDPEKVVAKIAEAAANHRRDFFDRAALDPLTGRVVAIGMLVFDARGEAGPDLTKCEATAPQEMDTSRTTLTRPTDTLSHSRGRGTGGRWVIIGHEDEARTLREFWDVCRGEMGRVNQMVGFNTHAFDLPFLVRRSWRHRVAVPFGIRRGRYWAEEMVDVREAWQLGDRQARGSLDSIAKHLGVGAKNGDGKAFAQLWQSDRKQAESYLRNDLLLTRKVAEAMGLCV